MRLVCILFSLLIITGCSSVSPIRVIDHTDRDLVDYPKIGERVTKSIGESLAAKGVRTTQDALEILESTRFNKAKGEFSIMTCAASVIPGTFFRRGVYESKTRNAECYGPVTYRLTLSDGSTNWNCPGQIYGGDICKDSTGKYFLAVRGYQLELLQDFDHIRLTKKIIERQQNFVQEIIYNGRVGDYLKFIYREFSDNIAHPAFTQEAQYDLSKSSFVVFKNLRLEIIEASTTEITYKLLSNF